MIKYYVRYEANTIMMDEMQAEIVFRPASLYKESNEHMYKILSGKFKDEVLAWWALCDSKEEAEKQAQKIYEDLTKKQLRNFFQLMELIKSNKFHEKCKWR